MVYHCAVRGTWRWWLAGYLLLTLSCTATWLLLDQRLSGQSGLRRQVWLSNDFQGAPFVTDVSPGAGLEFLDDDPRLPRRFFSARWLGYWYVPTARWVTVRVNADDYVDIWIDGEHRFSRSTAAARSIMLDAGFHELRIEYQQYDGAAHLALLSGSLDGYPRPLQTEDLFPERPEAGALRLLVVRNGFLVIASVLWIAGAFSTILILFRRYRTSSTTNNALQVPVLNRYDVAALATLCLAMLIYGYGNLSLRMSATDSLENLTLGIRLAQEGVYERWPGQVGDHRREPFGPSLIAITDLAADTLGREPLPLECISDERVFLRDDCRLAYAPYRIANLGLILTAALCVFLLVLRLTESRVLAYLGFLLTAQSAALLASADTFLTEIHAAALMAATGALSWATVNTGRSVYAAMLGLALAALVLTKASFAYLWIPVAVALAAADLLQRRIGWKTAGLVSVMLLAHCIPVGAWMTRNYLMSGDFSIIEARSASVLGYRASYNRMRHDEWLAGFAYYFPLTRPNLPTNGIPDESFQRFEMQRADGFRQTERSSYEQRRAELWHDGNPALAKLDELEQRRWVNDKLAAQSVDSLLADPLQHLKVSLLFFWRGAFTENGLGFPSNPVNQRLADVHGLPDWPRWRWTYGGITLTLVNLVGLLAIFVVPFWFWLGRGRFDVALIFLPALYAHGAYAVTSHFLPRYAEPQIPLRVTATMLLLFLACSTLQQLVQSSARSSGRSDSL